MRVFVVCLLGGQQDLLSKFLIEVLWGIVEFSKFSTLDISIINILVFWIHFEKLISLTVVCSLIISKFDICLNRDCSCGMNMMESTLWHGIKSFKKFAFFHPLLVLVKVVNGGVVRFFIDDFIPHLSQLFRCFPLIIS